MLQVVLNRGNVKPFWRKRAERRMEENVVAITAFSFFFFPEDEL